MRKSLRNLFLLLIVILLGKPLTAQDYLVDFTFLGSRSKFELYIFFGQPVDYAINMYKIRYVTNDIHGVPDTASGLMVLPQVANDVQLPIVVYDHGTTSGPSDVPSNLRGGYEVAMGYGAFGFATLAPDYLGLGDARGFHPYVHAASEASASLDMLFAGYEYLEFHDPDVDPNFLFLSGYSQGGHASMALHKLIDDFWSIIIPVTAATHMSGPYNMSGIMKDRLLGDQPYGSPAYLAYIVLGYDQVYDLYTNLDEVFEEPYRASIDSFYQGSLNLTVLNSHLISELAANGETLTRDMLQDTLLASILANPDHKFNLALQDNDLYNWAPASPTRLYYCGADEQVPFENATSTAAIMQGLGATDVAAVNQNPNFTHGQCVLPSVISSIDYFLSFVHPSGIKELDPSAPELTFFPNPASDEVNVLWTAASGGFDYQIFNTSGAEVGRGTTSSDRLSLSNLPAGLYMVLCTTGGQTMMGRILRQ